jgi:Ricin-type beta-trefoil lectin domain-like
MSIDPFERFNAWILAGAAAVVLTACGGGESNGINAPLPAPLALRQEALSQIDPTTLKVANAVVAPTTGGIYTLRSACGNKVLDVSGVSSADGAKVWMWQDTGARNQQWKLQDSGNGYYALLAQHSGKALDPKDWGTSNATPMQQWGYSGSDNQQFKLEAQSDGSYKITGKLSGKALDVAGANMADGTLAQLWQDNGTCAQRWVFTAVGITPPPVNGETPNSLERVADSMSGSHEGFPSGTNADWAQKPRMGRGNNPPKDWFAMTPWGQIYVERQGNPAVNTRVQIKDMAAWYISKSDGRWRKWVASPSVEGNMYREDFANDATNPNPEAPIRAEVSGGKSAKPGGGYNFHFWPAMPSRVAMDPNDIAGVWTVFKVRLIKDKPDGIDDRSKARFIASAGADYWRSLDAQWKSDWSNNGDIGIGKFYVVTNDWQSINFTTLTLDQLRQNPPPISNPFQ